MDSHKYCHTQVFFYLRWVPPEGFSQSLLRCCLDICPFLCGNVQDTARWQLGWDITQQHLGVHCNSFSTEGAGRGGTAGTGGEWLAASSFRAWLGNASKGLCAAAQSCVQFPPLHLTTCPGFKGLNWVERPKGTPLHSSSPSQCDSWKMSKYFNFPCFKLQFKESIAVTSYLNISDLKLRISRMDERLVDWFS